MAVDTMHPATPSDETMNPITWQMVVDMVSPPARGGETAPESHRPNGSTEVLPTEPPETQQPLSDAFH